MSIRIKKITACWKAKLITGLKENKSQLQEKEIRIILRYKEIEKSSSATKFCN